MPEVAELLHRPEAIAIAKAFIAEIESACTRLVVAGSLRRRLAWVGDVEIVCAPKIETIDLDRDLFGAAARGDVDLLDARMTMLLDKGRVTKRLDKNGSSRWGSTIKLLSYRGAPIDLFAPAEADRFGWILALRTGPAAFSRQLVVERGKRTKDGRPGLLPLGVKPGSGWLTRRVSGERIPTPNEADVFDLFGLPYAEPWERS